MAYGSSKEGGYGANIPVTHCAKYGYDGDAGGAPALGKILSTAGDVTITRPGTGVFRVSVGDCLFASDLIETGANGRVIITFTDGSKFRLGGGAAFALEDMFGAETARGAALVRILKGVFASSAAELRSAVSPSIRRSAAFTRARRRWASAASPSVCSPWGSFTI